MFWFVKFFRSTLPEAYFLDMFVIYKDPKNLFHPQVWKLAKSSRRLEGCGNN